MANLNITPQTVLLTSGQAVTFSATDGAGRALAVNWTLNAPIGSFAVPATPPLATNPSAVPTPLAPSPPAAAPPTPTPPAAAPPTPTPPAAAPPTPTPPAAAASATYIAPSQVLSPLAVTVIAISAVGDTATASICLTPNPIAITPATVELKQTQQQQFNVAVAGDPANKVTWNISPNIGKIQDGLYTAPDRLNDSVTVAIIATTDLCKKSATATVTLTPPPWTGPGRNALGIYLLAIFLLVFLLIDFWPPSLPDSATAKADRLDAAKTAGEKANALTKAKEALDTATTAAAKTEAQATLDKAQKESNDADGALKDKQDIEEKVTSPTVVPPWGPISRDIDLILLVLLGGALGSFLHSARSFADFVGNKRIVGSWAWWYLLHPFMGAIMALVFYAAVRGGFLAITGGANVRASDLSPYGVTAIAALVGMFSNQATQKLADIFDVLFKPSSGKELKNPLDGTTPATPSGGTTSASSSGSSTAATQAGSAPAAQTKT